MLLVQVIVIVTLPGFVKDQYANIPEKIHEHVPMTWHSNSFKQII